MARKLTSVEYDALVQRLERMADGIARHKGEDGFPKPLDDVKRRAMRQELESLREQYEAATNAAQKAYDAYLASFTNAEGVLSKDGDLVHGFYGKKNQVVADFGVKVLTAPNGRKKAKSAEKPAKS